MFFMRLCRLWLRKVRLVISEPPRISQMSYRDEYDSNFKGEGTSMAVVPVGVAVNLVYIVFLMICFGYDVMMAMI